MRDDVWQSRLCSFVLKSSVHFGYGEGSAAELYTVSCDQFLSVLKVRVVEKGTDV